MSLFWRNTHDVSSFIALAKTVAVYFRTKDGEQMFCQVFDTDSDMKVHALHYATSCTRKIFLSKLKLRQTRQTGRKNKKLSKAEIGYD